MGLFGAQSNGSRLSVQHQHRRDLMLVTALLCAHRRHECVGVGVFVSKIKAVGGAGTLRIRYAAGTNSEHCNFEGARCTTLHNQV